MNSSSLPSVLAVPSVFDLAPTGHTVHHQPAAVPQLDRITYNRAKTQDEAAAVEVAGGGGGGGDATGAQEESAVSDWLESQLTDVETILRLGGIKTSGDAPSQGASSSQVTNCRVRGDGFAADTGDQEPVHAASGGLDHPLSTSDLSAGRAGGYPTVKVLGNKSPPIRLAQTGAVQESARNLSFEERGGVLRSNRTGTATGQGLSPTPLLEQPHFNPNPSTPSRTLTLDESRPVHTMPPTNPDRDRQGELIAPQIQLLSRGRFHDSYLLGDDPVRRRQHIVDRTAKALGVELLPAPLEVEALERELDRLRMHLQLTVKEREDVVRERVQQCVEEYERKLGDQKSELDQVRREWELSRSEFVQQMSRYRQELSVAKQAASAVEPLKRELQQQRHAYEEKVESLQQQLERAKAEQLSMAEAHAAEVSRFRRQESQQAEELKNLHQTVHRLQSQQNDEAKALFEQDTIRRLKQRIEQLEAEGKEIRQQGEIREKHVQALNQQVAAGHRAIAEAERLRRQHENTVARKVEESQGASKELLRLVEANLAEVQSQLAGVLEENAFLTQQLAQTRARPTVDLYRSGDYLGQNSHGGNASRRGSGLPSLDQRDSPPPHQSRPFRSPKPQEA